MRRRWRWPILRRLAKADEVQLVGAYLVWLIGGFVFLITPAMIVDTDRYDNVRMGTYLLVALIVWAIPLLAGALAVLVELARFVVDEYGRDLLPRRVTESAEDLRKHYRD